MAVLLSYLAAALWVLRTGRGIAQLLMLTYSTLLAFVGLELFVRAAWPADSLVKVAPLPPGMRVPIEDTEGKLPGILPGAMFSVNRLGLRAPEMDFEQLRGTDVKILFVGGSTTMCPDVDDEDTFPWKLMEILSERLEKNVFVGNGGRAGLQAAHHARLIELYDATSEFDWVVVMCGVNDWGHFLDGRHEEMRDAARDMIVEAWRDPLVRPVYVYYRKLRIVEGLEAAWQSRPRRGSRRAAMIGFTSEVVDFCRADRRTSLRERPITEMPEEMEEMERIYREDLRDIIVTARARGVKLLMLTQPVLYHDDMPAELSELLMGVLESRGALVPEIAARINRRMNDVMIEVCREEGTDCLDLDAMLPKDTTVFFDDCHFNVSGCRRIAEILADHFAPQPGDSAPAPRDERPVPPADQRET
ncbi:MAG: SGNH/GDSL hydrolase family protein [Planctomycetaceae bacterium]